MRKKTNLCILFRDAVVDVVWIDRSVLGVQIKFMERLPRDEAVYETIAAQVKAAPVPPSRVTLGVPRDQTIQRTLRYPAAVRDDLDQMIQFEATRHVPLAEAERLIAWDSALTPDEEQVVVNLVAARRGDVGALIERFEEAGVPVDEAVPFSALVAESFADQPTLLVLADETQVELCLYGEGALQDSQSISRIMPGFGAERLLVAARQMVAQNKAWLGDEGIGRIYCGGPASVSPTFEQDLGTAFGLHVRPIEVPEELNRLVTDETVLAEALLAECCDAPPTLNLIEDKQRKVPISRRTLIVGSLCLLLLVELIAAFVLHTLEPKFQRARLQREIEDLKKDTAPIETKRNENRTYRKQLFQLERVCGSRASSMEIMQVISDTLPEDTYLRELRCNHEEIELGGYSKAPDKLPELVMAIPFVETINTSDIGPKNGDYQEFSLSARLRR